MDALARTDNILEQFSAKFCGVPIENHNTRARPGMDGQPGARVASPIPSHCRLSRLANAWRKSISGLECRNAVRSCVPGLGPSSCGGVVCRAVWHAYRAAGVRVAAHFG